MADNGKAVEKSKGFIGEFREFIMRGNVMDLAVGVIIGGAFQAGRFIALKAYLKKQEKSQINNLTLHLK